MVSSTRPGEIYVQRGPLVADVNSADELMNKARVVMLWSIKVLATTIGETGADYPAVHGGLGAVINGAITTVLLVLALGWQTATTLLRMSSLPQVFFTTQELSACCSRPHHHAALHG